MRILQSLLFAPLVLFAATTPSIAREVISVQYIENAKILSISTPCCGSGVLVAWAIIEVATPDQLPLDIYVVYFGEDDKFPAVKARCSFLAKEAQLESGITPDNRAYQNTQQFSMRQFTTAKMDCGGVVYKFADMLSGEP